MRKRPLANLLYHIGKLENLLINQRLASINLRMTHAHVLRYIQKHPGCIQKEVADYLFYQPASFTNVVKLLEKRKMIERRADPNNGLKKQLFLLPAGIEVLRQVNDAFEEVNQLVGTVDHDTLAALEKISINLEKQI
ncbi:MarR family transcriptional regulator [Lactobacillus johnsonii 16]|jgi:DNA-binding MarR family transcriptional regulator|uniref:MarR family winged helix-turn-helix transcriptional regulator n=1 Tax=Lactobacillus johnsonii TaxID=33959 RepID=UPI00069D2AE1|nr:MarR family transcriptional regulator [Lactobacillus johnsonii]KOH01893.1 MarR family transcriptional regulator [Lactobacillus johnsonii 16]